MANELEIRLKAIHDEIANDVKTLDAKQGADALNTTAQNVSAAINELLTLIGSAGVSIDDTAGDTDTTVVWSASKVYNELETAKQAVKNDLTNGATAAYDTFAELQALMEADDTVASALATTVGQKVDYTVAQTLTLAQRQIACSNIGVGDPDYDFLADYIATRDA